MKRGYRTNSLSAVAPHCIKNANGGIIQIGVSPEESDAVSIDANHTPKSAFCPQMHKLIFMYGIK